MIMIPLFHVEYKKKWPAEVQHITKLKDTYESMVMMETSTNLMLQFENLWSEKYVLQRFGEFSPAALSFLRSAKPGDIFTKKTKKYIMNHRESFRNTMELETKFEQGKCMSQ